MVDMVENWIELFWKWGLYKWLHLHCYKWKHSCWIHQSYLRFVIYESCRNGSSLQSKAPSESSTRKLCFGLKGAPSSSLSSFLFFMISFNLSKISSCFLFLYALMFEVNVVLCYKIIEILMSPLPLCLEFFFKICRYKKLLYLHIQDHY